MSDQHRRMLDMLAGWEKFVAACADADTPPSPEPTKDEYQGEWYGIFDLYQECGRHSCPTENWIRDFMVDRVLPFILEGQAPQHKSEDKP